MSRHKVQKITISLTEQEARVLRQAVFALAAALVGSLDDRRKELQALERADFKLSAAIRKLKPLV
jgi:hypothetical protein